MRNSSKIGLLLFGLTLLVIAVIDVTRQEPIDWRRSFNQRDKIPYGLYVVHEELPNILGEGVQVKDLTSTVFPDIRDTLKARPNNSLVYVVDYFDESPQVVDELLSFVDKGGEVFISANQFYNGL